MAYLKPDKTSKWNGLTVNSILLIKQNNPNKIEMPWAANQELQFHNTDWINVSSSTPAEQYTRAME